MNSISLYLSWKISISPLIPKGRIAGYFHSGVELHHSTPLWPVVFQLRNELKI
jgi:hypothetical protein